MTEKEQLAENEFEGIDQALRRAAQTAKKMAEQNGTPYVVVETIRNPKPEQVKSGSKQSHAAD